MIFFKLQAYNQSKNLIATMGAPFGGLDDVMNSQHKNLETIKNFKLQLNGRCQNIRAGCLKDFEEKSINIK